MKISTKGRYGLRILIDLAMHDPGKPRMLKDIAQSQQISEKYISRLVIDLRRAKLVRSVRGVNGGFHLAKLPEEIRKRFYSVETEAHTAYYGQIVSAYLLEKD